jgi:hypothetical protein
VTGTVNDGVHVWSVPSTPSAYCRVKVVAHDGSGNTGQDTSNGNFEISTEWDPWSYDTLNPYGVISKPEVINAIQDYFNYLIEKWQVIDVIQLYFS